MFIYLLYQKQNLLATNLKTKKDCFLQPFLLNQTFFKNLNIVLSKN